MNQQSLRSVLFAAAEMSPLVSVGGLAEVVRFLPKSLRQAGYDARVVIPDYRPLLDGIERKPVIHDLPVRVGDRGYQATISKTVVDGGTPVYLVAGAPGFESVRDGKKDIYSKPEVHDYCFFATAVLEFLETTTKDSEDWTPQVLHAHDHHTAFASIYLKTAGDERWSVTRDQLRTVLTVHNLGFPGWFGRNLLPELGLPQSLDSMKWMEFYDQLSPLKGGILLSDLVTTVSPTYGMEILSDQYGEGLNGVLQQVYRRGRLRGILNGVDRLGLTEEAKRGDPPFTLDSDCEAFLPTKEKLKKRLCDEYGLASEPDKPVLIIMGRWGWQKGWPIFAELLLNGYLSDFNVLIETWASAGQDAALMDQLRQYVARNPKSVAIVEGEPRSLLRLAGPDFVLLPSIYEPCGLIQMEAMVFATIPIVRKTGGLADTIHDGENGLVFERSLTVHDMENETMAFFEAVKELGSTVAGRCLCTRTKRDCWPTGTHALT
jgi:starch synthase